MRPELDALGQRVREARIAMSMTQQQLAERVDCSPEWISKIERGRASPSLGCITTIGNVLGTDLTILLRPSKTEFGASLPEQAASMVRALDANNQRLAVYLVEALLRRQREQEATART